MWFIGIDPGLSGGVAVVDADGRLVALSAIPLIKGGREDGRDTLDACALATMLRGDSTSMRVSLERLGSRPGQSAQSYLTSGRNYGIVDGVLQMLGMRVEYPTPQEWQKVLGVARLPKGSTATARKQASRAAAQRLLGSPMIERLPASADGQWEAALLALYTMRRWVRCD